MPQTITRKCQDAFDYVQRKLENFNYGIRTFGNTEVEVYSNGLLMEHEHNQILQR